MALYNVVFLQLIQVGDCMVHAKVPLQICAVLNQREAEKETNFDTIKAKEQWAIIGRFDTPRVQVVKRSIVRISFFTGILIVFKGYNLFPALVYPIKYFKELPDTYTLLSYCSHSFLQVPHPWLFLP